MSTIKRIAEYLAPVKTMQEDDWEAAWKTKQKEDLDACYMGFYFLEFAASSYGRMVFTL